MGKVPRPDLGMPQIHTRLSWALLEKVTAAARRIDQPLAAYVRLALVEKLDRDGGGSDASDT